MRHILFLFFLSLSAILHAQPFEWGSIFGGVQSDAALRLAAPESEGVIVAGNFNVSMEIGGQNVLARGFQDAYVACFNDASQLLWVSVLGGIGTDQVSAICLDFEGNVWVAGRFTGKMDVDPGADSTFVLSQPANGLDGFLVKLSVSDGSLLDYKDISGGGVMDIRSIKADVLTQSIFMGGQYSGTVDFDFGTTVQQRTSTVNSGDAFIGKYSSSFDYGWVNTFGSATPVIDFVSSVGFDSQGSVYCTGLLGGTADIDAGIGVTNLTCATDAYLIKYSKSTGALQWGFNLGGNSLENGTHILVRPDDEIVLAGTMSSATFDADPGFASYPLNSNGISSAPFVVRYLPSGQLVSGFVLAGSSGTTIALGALQVSMNNNLIVAGNYTGTLNWLDSNGQLSAFSSGDSSDTFIAELDGLNQYLQIKRITGSGNQSLSDVLVKGPVMYACGQLDGPTLPDLESAGFLVPSNSSNQAYVFRYNDNPTLIVIPQNTPNEALVYPNPASNIVHVVVEDLIGLELYSSDGRCVLQSANGSMNVSVLPAGLYYMRSKTSNGECSNRLLVGFN